MQWAGCMRMGAECWSRINVNALRVFIYVRIRNDNNEISKFENEHGVSDCVSCCLVTRANMRAFKF